MIFSRPDNDQLHISLTYLETLQIFGSTEQIDRNDPKTRSALRLLLKKAISDRLIKPDVLSVYVEVTKNIAGGYDIHFTRNRPSAESAARTELSVLEFADIKSALSAAKAIYRISKPTSSSFYRLGKGYRLVVRGGDHLKFAREFADRITSCPIRAAITLEHGKRLIEENAVEILSGL